MKLYCTECNKDLTIHADGTIACSCALQRAGDTIPASWVNANDESEPVSAGQLEDWRAFAELGA